jgi:Flp pilus assembly protein TadG
MTRTKRRRTFHRGQSMVEFALAAPVFLLLLFGTIEFGRLVWTIHELENGTREAMRYAVVHGADSGDPADVGDMETVHADRTSIDATLSCTNCGGTRGTTVVVSATYSFQPIVTTLIGLSSTISLSSQSEGVIHH